MKGFVNQVVALVFFLFFCACAVQAQTIVPTQTDVIIIDNGTSGKADPGDRIQYKVTIQNTGVASGTGVQLNVVPDPRTTFLAGTFKSSPLAVPDVYTCTGNVGISVPAASGVKTNDFDDNLAGATLSVTTPPTNGTATLNNDGSFTYTPNAGFNGMDVFTYTITDVTPVPAAPTTDMATVTITVSNMIWFVDNTGGGSGGTGTLSNPFKTLANFNASALPLAGHVVFVKHSGTAYRGGIVLKNNMYLFGTGHSGGSNLADSGVLPFTVAVNSPALPAINGSRTVIINDFLNGASPYYGITLASGNTIRGVEVGRCDGIKIFGSNFGTLTVGNTTNPDVALSGNKPALDLTNGVFAATSKFAFINSPDTSTIEINTVSGSLACSSTLVNARDGATAIDIQNSSAALDFGSTTANHFNGGTVISITNSAAGSVTFSNLSIPNLGNGVGLIANAGGTINIGGTASNIIARTALNITNTSFGAGATFASITATNFFSTPGVNLNNVTGGPLVINGGSISSIFATANAFDVNAGSSDITYAGTISYTGTSSARTVEVTARTGGTVTLSGNITANTGTGINVASNTGGTVVFSGATKNLGTGASNAVTLATNTGSTINFTGGGLVLATTSGTGFSATGGGTVNVTGSGNTISSTTGTALNVANTTIGSSNLNFQSISSNGGTAAGIILNTTGTIGGLVVNGDGLNTTKGGNASGGTIANKSDGGTNDSGLVGTAIFLNNTSNVVLQRMQINDCQNFGIRGLDVGNFTFQYSTINGSNGNTNVGTEDCIGFGTSQPAGANGLKNGAIVLIDNCIIRGAVEHNVEFYNIANTFNVTVSNCNITNNSLALGGDGIQIELHTDSNAGTAAANGTFSIQNCFFDDNKSQPLQAAANGDSFMDITINNCMVQKTTQGNEGFLLSNGTDGDLVAHVTNNTITGIGGAAIFVGQTAGNATANSSLTAVITGNTIVHPTTSTNSAIIAFLTSCDGVGFCALQAATANILIDNNTVTQNSTGGVSRGIFVDTPDNNTIPSYTVTVTNNTVHVGDGAGGVNGIALQCRRGSGCFDVRGNTVDFPNGNTGSIFGLRVRQAAPGALNLERGAEALASPPLTVLNTNNPATTNEVFGTITVVDNNACLTPPN